MARTSPPERLALDSVPGALMDCIQVNLGVLADHHHGAGTSLRLGATLRLRWWTAQAGELPTVDPPLAEQLAEAEHLLGLRVRDRSRMTRDAMLRALREHGGTRYVVADSYAMPWLPYRGRRHMEHSFLLTAADDHWQITDAYRNETQWGAATPGHWALSDDQLAGIDLAEVIDLEPVAAPKPAASFDGGAPDAFLAAYDAFPDRARALEQLTVETWLLARSRRLHAMFRAHAGRPVDEEHLRRWDHVVEQTYLAHRRVARGRAEPPGVLHRLGEALAADATAFGDSAVAAGPGDGAGAFAPAGPDRALRLAVAGVVSAVLGVARQELLDGAAFDSFAAFSSFRLVEIVERVETELGVEFDADELVPENLRQLDDLCRIAG
jgi:acyl carrier protein